MKKSQFGGALAGVLITLGIIASIGIIVVMMLVNAYNKANSFDQQVKYIHQDNKNILAQYGQKVLEAAQVPDMAREDLMKVATAALQGRYGANGSQAVFQMITEQNPTVDPQLYRKIQQLIESGRNEFQAAQTRLLDVKRSYETALGSVPGGFLMRALGFPKVPLDTYNIVTTERAEKAFETGREAPMKLR